MIRHENWKLGKNLTSFNETSFISSFVKLQVYSVVNCGCAHSYLYDFWQTKISWSIEVYIYIYVCVYEQGLTLNNDLPPVCLNLLEVIIDKISFSGIKWQDSTEIKHLL